MQITADVSKILKNFQSDLTFIFDALSEPLIGFVSFLAVLAIKNVASFTKNCFYRKVGCVTMSNYVETFYNNLDHNLVQKL